MNIIDFIIDNKEWIFSGIGVMLVILISKLIKLIMWRIKQRKIHNPVRKFAKPENKVEKSQSSSLGDGPKRTANVIFTVKNRDAEKIIKFIDEINIQKRTNDPNELMARKNKPMITVSSSNESDYKTSFNCTVWNMELGKLDFLCQKLINIIPSLECKISLDNLQRFWKTPSIISKLLEQLK
jgi:hypothetical protein